MKDPDYYTWFQRCIEPMLILEAHNPSLMERRPSTAMSAVSNQWFETLFFIQWSDWPAIRSVSEEIDRVLQKFPASPNGWYPDISGAQAMLMMLKSSYFFCLMKKRMHQITAMLMLCVGRMQSATIYRECRIFRIIINYYYSTCVCVRVCV